MAASGRSSWKCSSENTTKGAVAKKERREEAGRGIEEAAADAADRQRAHREESPHDRLGRERRDGKDEVEQPGRAGTSGG